MAIPVAGRLKWRRTAPFHVQLEVETPADIDRVPGNIQIQGRTIRVFRTDDRLAVGDRVVFTLGLCDPGDEPDGPAFIYFDEFATARYMEVYLYGDPPNCKLAAYEFSVIDAPSEEPTLTPRQLEDMLGKELKDLFGDVENARGRLPEVPKATRRWH